MPINHWQSSDVNQSPARRFHELKSSVYLFSFRNACKSRQSHLLSIFRAKNLFSIYIITLTLKYIRKCSKCIHWPLSCLELFLSWNVNKKVVKKQLKNIWYISVQKKFNTNECLPPSNYLYKKWTKHSQMFYFIFHFWHFSLSLNSDQMLKQGLKDKLTIRLCI